MPLPVDIPAIFKAFTDTRGATETPIAVSVFIDDTAPGDVVGHVRASFASSDANVRVTMSYLGAGMPVPYEADDMAVIVAGTSERVGAQAAYLRECGLPVMVVTTLPNLVGELARVFGDPIPDGDLIAPVRPVRRTSNGRTAAQPAGGQASAQTVGGQAFSNADAALGVIADDTGAPDGFASAAAVAPAPATDAANAPAADAPASDGLDEVIVLDKDAAALLDTRMGEWIIAACRGARLAFAHAFPFVRRPLALDSVNATSLENTVVGLVPLVRGADMPVMTLNQVKMLLQIAAAYGQPISRARIKEIVVVVAGGFAFRGIARRIAGFVPVIGWAVRAAVGFSGTQAMGRAAIDYFAVGGDIVGLASVVQAARDGVVSTASNVAHSPAGHRAADIAKSAASGIVDRVRGKS